MNTEVLLWLPNFCETAPSSVAHGHRALNPKLIPMGLSSLNTTSCGPKGLDPTLHHGVTIQKILQPQKQNLTKVVLGIRAEFAL